MRRFAIVCVTLALIGSICVAYQLGRSQGIAEMGESVRLYQEATAGALTAARKWQANAEEWEKVANKWQANYEQAKGKTR